MIETIKIVTITEDNIFTGPVYGTVEVFTTVQEINKNSTVRKVQSVKTRNKQFTKNLVSTKTK